MSGPEDMYSVRIGEGLFGPVSMEGLVHWAQEGRITAQTVITPVGGGASRQATEIPDLARIIAAPPTRFTGLGGLPDAGSDVEMLIPYRNTPALVGYYLSVASLIPLVGNVTGPIAVFLGVVGLRKRAAEPHVRGGAHAWVAIILGGLMALLYNGMVIAAIVAGAMR